MRRVGNSGGVEKNALLVIEFQHIDDLEIVAVAGAVYDAAGDGEEFPRIAPLHAQGTVQSGVDLDGGDVVEGGQEVDGAVLEGDGQDEALVGGERCVRLVGLFHFELLTGPCHGRDANLGAELDLGDHRSVDVHNDDLAGGGAEVDLLVIGSPDAASDGRVEV